VIERRVHDLAVARKEARVCLEARVSVRGVALRFFVCHFGLGFRERALQAQRLDAILRAAPRDAPRLVLGDFNEWHRGPVHRAIKASFPNAPEPQPTHPSPLPLLALDRIAWDDALHGEVHVARVRAASDHRMIRATLTAPD
jgi:endonuclease/exonuclease/phosphatase family metal-dependent hydrolase